MNVELLRELKEALPGTTDGTLKRCVTALVRRNEAWRAAFMPGTPIRSRNRRKIGHVTDEERECDAESCLGYMFQVRWEDGALGWVCTTDVEQLEDGSWALVDWEREYEDGIA
jgi:hypothetical protein